jgi:hypothetical protein
MQMVVATLYGTKNFILNTPLMSSALLGYDILDKDILEEKFKPRIKTYLKNLLKAYLVKENDNSK